MRVLLLNGPPRSGKNTAANIVARHSSSATVLGFSWYLKRMVHAVYLGRDGWDMDPDCFDAIKGVPQAILAGRTWRQEYIRFSEDVQKPVHGHEWFADRFMETARASGADLIVVPDSGFRGEAERVVRELGAHNVRLVRMIREGCTFAGDSRTYIDLADLGVSRTDVWNHNLHLLGEDMDDVIRAWRP
ncbi:MAG: hypothetical protein ACRYHQ_08760 [Janthinobacterium lividum]